jgi:hypothetical protein
VLLVLVLVLLVLLVVMLLVLVLVLLVVVLVLLLVLLVLVLLLVLLGAFSFSGGCGCAFGLIPPLMMLISSCSSLLVLAVLAGFFEHTLPSLRCGHLHTFTEFCFTKNSYSARQFAHNPLYLPLEQLRNHNSARRNCRNVRSKKE